MKLISIVPLLSTIVVSVKLSDKCKVVKGTYFDQKCYLYINHTVLNWNDAMDYCNFAMEGYNGHLAHVLSSKTLTILKDLTRPIPTGINSIWDWYTFTFIGAKVDQSNSVAMVDHRNARFATQRNKLIDDVSVADTYLGTLKNTQDYYRELKNWGIMVWLGLHVDMFDWEVGEIGTTSSPQYFFSQINEQYSSMVNTKLNRVLKLPLLNGYTVAKEFACFEECSMHKLCRGFNYNDNSGSCELTSWDPVDVAPSEIEENSSWKFFIVKLKASQSIGVVEDTVKWYCLSFLNCPVLFEYLLFCYSCECDVLDDMPLSNETILNLIMFCLLSF